MKNKYYLFEEEHLDIEEEKPNIENELINTLSNSEIQQEALRLIRSVLSKPVKWTNMFDLIENIRRDMQSGRDNYDSSANDTQLSLITPLLVFFSLTVKTSMQMTPIDSEIIINLLADNFKDITHLKELEKILNEIQR
jgi:hypothetical protein